ncbi:UDP-4-amino-4,6-dideoxy-N-acetyl-beta-L-altrosamine transaminase [Rhodanobacter aciditrophus]|uniref:UDP-4-amino-4, 6-dideoxy-N-acetyl-beta-L-altrosamine transaminase n=1 Tax=Rhodanobacter aciditrophus TaxID=1623218 RepID=A0ABW4B4E2_9GAMM
MSKAFIPYGRQSISAADVEAVCEALTSDYLTQGPLVPEFENSVAELSQCKYAIAANSATSALHVACLALGVGPGDLVWTTPNTFIASANCALYCDAQVDFVDIDPQTYNLCPIQLKEKLELAKFQNRLPKVVIPVHFGGHPCDMRALHELSKEYGFYIIEDASHAIGAKFKGQPVGSRYSDICVFSFHPVKVMTTAEGGMAVTNKEPLADAMRLLVHQGVTKNKREFQTRSPGDWYYEQQDLGFNYRMTELQAALGISQLKRLNQFIEKRRERVQNYYKLLQGLPIQLPSEADYAFSSWHLFPIVLFEALEPQRALIFQYLREQQIGTQVHYIPVHTQPFYQEKGFAWGDFPQSEEYYQRCLSLPLYPDLTYEEQVYVANALREAIDRAFVA